MMVPVAAIHGRLDVIEMDEGYPILMRGPAPCG